MKQDNGRTSRFIPLKYLFTLSLFQRWEGILRVICIVAWTALLCGGVFVNALAGDGLFPPADHGPIETSDCRYLASQCDYGLVAR